MRSGIVHHKSDRKSCVIPTADRNNELFIVLSPEEEVAEMSNMMKIAEMTRKPPTPVNESQAPSQPAASDDTLQDPFSLDALTRVSHLGVINSNQST